MHAISRTPGSVGSNSLILRRTRDTGREGNRDDYIYVEDLRHGPVGPVQLASLASETMKSDEQQKSGKYMYYIVGALQRCMPSFKVFNTLHCTMLSLSGYL